jgi:uncharacterized membrane protein (UPF0127 family)
MLKKIIITLLILISISKISNISFAESPLNQPNINENSSENYFASNLNNYKDIVTINRNGKEIAKFNVIIANDPARKKMGLMHIKSLPQDYGMLFMWDKLDSATIIRMWMKNTIIPLDMIFFDDDNRIIKIHSMAKPLSLDIISSEKKSRLVLEINGGLAKKLQLQLGDQYSKKTLDSL